MYRAVLVGAGAMGRNWGANLHEHPDVELVGWVDTEPGRAEEAKTELGCTTCEPFTSLESALENLAPDFVVDVTPPEIHCSVTVTALEHGIPVLGEKPMADNIDQAKLMVAASERAGKLYMVSQSRRYHGSARAYRQLISDALGDLGMLNVDFYIGAHFGGFRDEMDSPLVLDMAIHTFDMGRMLSGRDCVSVYAEEFNPSWSWYRGDASADCLFEMEDGLQFNFRGSWCSEGCHTSWEGDWRAIGSEGTARWDGFDEIYAEVVAERGGFMSEFRRIDRQPLEGRTHIQGSLDDFLGALTENRPPKHGDCKDNIKSFAMVMAAKESARRRERVQLQELLG